MTNTAPPAEFTIGLVGTLPQEIELALALAGVETTTELARCRVVLAPEVSLDEISQLGARHLTIAGARLGDFERLAKLIKAGAADAVVTPLDPIDVVTKIRRVLRRRTA